MRGERLCIYVRNVSFPAQETGRCFHVNGITVNKTTQTVESAAAGGAFHIEDVYPRIDGGRFPVKRVAGERIEVWADIYRDGHDVMNAALVWRREQDREWRREPMTHHSNDRWGGSFVPDQLGRYVYAIEAWTEEFATWRHGFELKQKAGADLTLEAIEGAGMLTKAQAGSNTAAAVILRQCEDFLQTGDTAPLLTAELKDAMAESQLRPDLTRSQLFPLMADRPRARAGAWYEMVPRSQGRTPGQHGTFEDCIARLPDIAAMGFDVIYFTPIHPIGLTNRKGRDNALTAGPTDPGSPWAIGDATGGHEAVHPELGTIDDVRSLTAAAAGHGIDIALDFAIQCSADHPWLTEHPDWFYKRPDGTLKYAENPPKRYQDIYNVNFDTADWQALWNALRDVVVHWVERGITVFRVDNPHTKPIAFWEWLIADVQREHPETVFLAEAFTRPALMAMLAKAGFSQSYTYFTWRNTKKELTDYLTELATTEAKDFYRPHFFVNTPDINPIFLQSSGRGGFLIRAALAATLSGLWGMYSGFEVCEAAPLPGREEYLDSEKYQIRVRDYAAPGNIVAEITALTTTSHMSVVPRDTSAGCLAVRITAQPARTCKTIFVFPSGEAGITRPSDAAMDRRPTTMNSRPIMITTIQAGTSPI